MVRTGRVYGIHEPPAADGTPGALCYVGSTEKANRMHSHRSQCKSDPLCSPLYRRATELHGSMANYSEATLATLNLPVDDDDAAKEQLRSLEGLVLRSLRQHYPALVLLNKNSPRCENQRNRERGRAWRLSHDQGVVDADGRSMSYMAVRSRIYRARRRDRAAALATAAAPAAAATAAPAPEGVPA